MSEAPKRLAPTTETLRALFAKSSNQCAYPNCKHPLMDEDNNFIAQVCHIEDALPGGRFNKNMTNEERRSFSNLMLLCYAHHIKTNNIIKYTVPILKEIKSKHEENSKEEFEVESNTLILIFNDLKSIKENTTQILDNQRKHDNELLELKQLVLNSQQGEATDKGKYIAEIRQIMKLRDSKNQNAALKLLNQLKLEKWEELNGFEKYVLVANMGICQIELDNTEEGATNLIKAVTYDNDNAKALALAALGYSLLNNKPEAQSYLTKAMEKDIENPNAYMALIILEKDRLSFDEILDKIPTKLKNSQEMAFALGGLASQKRNHAKAINWFRTAIDLATDRKAEFKAALAATILDQTTNTKQILSGEVDNYSRNKITYAIELLTEAWESHKDSDLRKSGATFLLNRGIAKKFINDFNGAYDDIKLASKINEDNYFFLKHLAIICFETEKLIECSEVLNNLKTKNEHAVTNDEEINLFIAQVLIKQKEYDKALELLEKISLNSSNRDIRDEAKSNIINIYQIRNDFDSALQKCNSTLKDRPNYIRGHIDKAKLYFSINESAQAIESLKSAYEQVDDNSKFEDIQELAFEFARNREFSMAIELLEKITDSKVLSKLSTTLVKVYYEAGEHLKALKLCNNLKKGHPPIDFITEIQSSIYESIGDLPNAIAVCKEYLVTYPDDELIKFRLAVIFSRTKELEKVKDLLLGLSNVSNLPIWALFQLSSLHIRYGDLIAGLEIAYNTRAKNNNVGQVHEQYVRIVTEIKDLNLKIGEIKNVRVNDVVHLMDERGQVKKYLLTDNPNNNANDSLSIKDKLGSKIIGLAVGEKIQIERSWGESQQLELIEIQHKYIYAFQESIVLLNEKFIDTKGFQQFQIGTSGNIKEDLKPIFDSLDESEKFDNQLYDNYNKKLFTIGTCAGLKNQNPIKFWATVLGNPDLGIYTQQANILLPDNIKEKLENSVGLVIDLISLLTLASLNKLNLLESIPSKKYFALSTIEAINDLIDELTGISSKGYAIVGKHKGKYVRQYFSEAEVNKQKVRYESVLNWIKNNGITLPCNEALKMNAMRKKDYNKTLGESFVDSILIAKEQNYLLLVEEENLRAIALNDFQIGGLPSYSLFIYFQERGLLSQNKFDDIISKLIHMGYKYLPVNSNILFKCAELAEYKNIYPFDLAVQTLQYPLSSEDSAVKVSADFFYKLYSETNVIEVQINLVLPVLESLIIGRHTPSVIQKLIVFVNHKFMLLQKQKDELMRLILDFLRTK